MFHSPDLASKEPGYFEHLRYFSSYEFGLAGGLKTIFAFGPENQPPLDSWQTGYETCDEVKYQIVTLRYERRQQLWAIS